MIKIDSITKNNFDKRQWVKFVNSLSGPKSVNLVGSVSKSGQENLSIISSAFHLGANPPLMGYVSRPHSNLSPRHTIMNIDDTGYYTFNHVLPEFLEKAHQTSARYEREQSEFEMCDLKAEYLDGFKAPFVEASAIKIGLRLLEVKRIEQNNTDIVIGEIENVYLNKEWVRSDGSVDIAAANSVAVSGLDEYHSLNAIARLSYAKPDLLVTDISDIK